jgi:hypothetical protein
MDAIEEEEEGGGADSEPRDRSGVDDEDSPLLPPD